MRLEFGRGGGGGPQHPLHAEAGREQIAEDGRAARVRLEVGEERRMLPVRDPGEHDVVHVAEYASKGSPPLGGSARQCRANRARLRLRQHRERLDPLEIVGDPVDRLASVLAEFIGASWRAPCPDSIGPPAMISDFGPMCSSMSATDSRRATEMLFRRLNRHCTPTRSKAQPAIARMSTDSLAKKYRG